MATVTCINKTQGLPLLTYKEEGFLPISNDWLENEAYEKVLRSKVLVNTDVALVNPVNRTMYLAWRKAMPMQGWWIIGGNTGDINAPLVERLLTVVERETNLVIQSDRFVLTGLMEYFWKDRAQQPQDVGCHMFGLTFSVDITHEEAERIALDPKEYESGNIVQFTREDLVREQVFPGLIDLYDRIFPEQPPSAIGELKVVHTDTRRTIHEFNGEDFACGYFEIHHSNLPLGVHAHAKKSETFIISKGSGVLHTCKVDFHGNPLGPRRIQTLQEGSVAHLMPYEAHTFYLETGSRMYCYSSTPFDPDDFIKTPFLV